MQKEIEILVKKKVDLYKYSLENLIKKNEINKISRLFLRTILSNGKIITCGNGGSMSQAQHLTTELIVKYKKRRKSLPSVVLGSDPSSLTAIGNDFNFDKVFSRIFEGMANKNDLLVVFSTSGNSKNIIELLKVAKIRKIKTLGFFGNNGGGSKKFCSYSSIINSKETSSIQELHLILIHLIIEEIEKKIK